MKKYLKDFIVDSTTPCGRGYALLRMCPADGVMPPCAPGQFVEVHIPDAPHTFLRRPISINNVTDRELWLLVKDAGEGTHALCNARPGTSMSIMLPLGRGFTLPKEGQRALLVGGGVGIAPMLYLGSELHRIGAHPEFLIGARTAADLLQISNMEAFGPVHTCTEDGSAGTTGLVTAHPVLAEPFDIIYCCGPLPMMKAVGAVAHRQGVHCEVSLENKMACGVGACLCCVEDTREGHKCVCTDGPVFNIEELKWLI